MVAWSIMCYEIRHAKLGNISGIIEQNQQISELSQVKGRSELLGPGDLRLHVYAVGDMSRDTRYIIEGQNTLVPVVRPVEK